MEAFQSVAIRFIGPTGLIALALLLLALIPPLRLTWLERVVADLPRAMRAHHFLGSAFVATAAIHAVFATSPYFSGSGSLAEALTLYFDPSDVLTFSGAFSFCALFIAFLSSAWRNFPRATWLRVHHVSLFGFILAAGHAGLSWRRVIAPPFVPLDYLRVALGGGIILASVGLVAHFLCPEVLGTHLTFTVVERKWLAAGVVELTLRADRGREDWQGGEFGYFRFDCVGPCGVTKERHPFTVIEVFGEDGIRIAVKALGDDTLKLQSIALGTRGKVTGPYGSLRHLLPSRRPQLWIAGGLGLMPFLGLARRVGLDGIASNRIDLIYLFRTEDAAGYLEELRRLGASQRGFHFHPIATSLSHEPGIEEIERLVPDFRMREIALAGPSPMIKYWTRILLSNGVEGRRIHTEDFAA